MPLNVTQVVQLLLLLLERDELLLIIQCATKFRLAMSIVSGGQQMHSNSYNYMFSALVYSLHEELIQYLCNPSFHIHFTVCLLMSLDAFSHKWTGGFEITFHCPFLLIFQSLQTCLFMQIQKITTYFNEIQTPFALRF